VFPGPTLEAWGKIQGVSPTAIENKRLANKSQ